jgi:hypothetical protein
MAFLTMERLRQPVAAGGNGIGLFSRFREPADLPLIATGCNHGAPLGLHPLLSAFRYVVVGQPGSWGA